MTLPHGVRRNNTTTTATTATIATSKLQAMAEPSGQSNAAPNRSAIALITVTPEAPPMSWGVEKVADDQGENHESASDEPGRGQGQDEAEKYRDSTGAEVRGRFKQVIVERLEAQPNAEHHERKIIVHEHERGRGRTEQQRLDRSIDQRRSR